MTAPLPTGRQHVQALLAALPLLDLDRLESWGRRLAELLPAGARLLVAGNGGSAAEAQHLTAEFVGRLRDDRPPMSAIALHAETSSLTAIGNDYGYAEAFARSVTAHGRAGDVLVLLSTSGRSPNLLRAAEVGRAAGLVTWALTGPSGSPLAALADEAVCVDAPTSATIQEAHLLAIHVLCHACDVALGVAPTDEVAVPVAAGAGTGGRSAAGHRADLAARPDPAIDAERPAAAGTGQVRATRPAARLVVVGDTLLDRDITGQARRLAPDAPVPVLDDLATVDRPGGAGLAALLAAGDGHQVTLITALADDEGGRRLAELLDAAGVAVVDLGLAGPTPEKIRVRAGTHPLLRLDRGGAGGAIGGPLPAAGRRALESAGAILVSDYGRGMAAEPSVVAALAAVTGRAGAGRVPIVWDPHPRGGPPVPGVLLATPNAAEALHFAPAHPGTGLAAVTARGRALVEAWGVTAVAVTLGERGALVVGGAGVPPLVAPARSVPAGDPCGAGDRFASTAAAALALGALPSEAVTAATLAAGEHVAAGGAAALGSPADSAAPRPGGARDAIGADAFALVERVRAAGGTVVATGGCFDLLHAGHVQVLRDARALGDCLVVCLNSDDSVRRLKGADRPLVPAPDRAAVLASLGCVDAVVVFEEDTPAEVLSRLRPDVFAKGGDYAVADLPEAPVVASWGGQAVVLPYLRGRSTTSMIEEAVRRVSS